MITTNIAIVLINRDRRQQKFIIPCGIVKSVLKFIIHFAKKQTLLNDTVELCLARILKTEACSQLIDQCKPFRERVYTPLKTICVFVKQVLSTDKSCKKAVAGLAVEHFSVEKSVSTNTGPFCHFQKCCSRFSEVDFT